MNTVILNGGVSVLADALRLAWDLEARDVQLLVDDHRRPAGWPG